MFNPLPILALGAVAIGYAGAIDRTDQMFESYAPSAVAAFTSTSNLSVEEFVSKLPETVQDPYCAAEREMIATLTDDFAEVRQASWIRGDALKMELWASDVMGTWTVLHVGSEIVTCLVASGFGWDEGMTLLEVLGASALAS